jgi:type VI secretion system protein ImpM
MPGLSFQSVGLFGKIPAQGDFLRLGPSAPAVIAFDRWVQEGIDAARRAGTELPTEPLYFLFRANGVREALIGALARSSDAVGRTFPLAVYGFIDSSLLARAYPLVPGACASFLAAASDVLLDSAKLNAQQLAERLASMPNPTAEETLSAEDARRAVLNGARVGDLADRLFGGVAGGRQHYAFRTFLAACEPQRGKDADRPGVTLDCVVRSPVDRMLWLELGRRLLGWRETPPTLLWGDSPPRLLLSLGPAPSSLLLYLTKPDHGGQKLWPILTDRADAIAEAKTALAPAVRQALERPELSLEALLTQIAGAGA